MFTTVSARLHARSAACYDRTGRFDLSRRYHEMGWRSRRGDARLYVDLATSLDMQGGSGEAASVRASLAPGRRARRLCCPGGG